jgi:hypothetical protein
MKLKVWAALVAGAIVASAAPATVTISIEAAGVQNSTRALTGKQVASFDEFSNYVGTGSNIFSTGSISGTITDGGLLAWGANPYGGAGGTGQFATVYNTASIQLSSAVTFAGLWASAIDGDFTQSLGNTIAFYSGGSLLGSYALMPLVSGAGSAYYGNPNENFAGSDGNEPYAFFNFSSTTAFDRIDIVQNGGGGFEFDNLTIGNTVAKPSRPPSTITLPAEPAAEIPSGVPEASTWAMMLLGFGGMGMMIRRTRRATLATA